MPCDCQAATNNNRTMHRNALEFITAMDKFWQAHDQDAVQATISTICTHKYLDNFHKLPFGCLPHFTSNNVWYYCNMKDLCKKNCNTKNHFHCNILKEKKSIFQRWTLTSVHFSTLNSICTHKSLDNFYKLSLCCLSHFTPNSQQCMILLQHEGFL